VPRVSTARSAFACNCPGVEASWARSASTR
jgi:hypothetical protein